MNSRAGLHGRFFPMLSFPVLNAVPDGRTLNTSCIQEVIDACAEQGGGRVVLAGPGVYLSGGLRLRDHVLLHLEHGVTLMASGDLADYPLQDRWPAGFIFADNVEGAGITGRGCLDGNGEAFWGKFSRPHEWAEAKKPFGTWIPHFDYRPKPRPRAMILFSQCRGVKIEDVTIRNSMHWTLLFMACSDGVVRGMTMRNALHGPNTDGIDLDACSNFLVEDCDILTGDDAIALKNKNIWGLKRPSRNIIVRNCRLRSTTHGFTIGTETQDDFENIRLCDCIIERAGENRTLTGIGLSMIDGASVRNVHVSNVRIHGALAPIQIRLGNEGRGQTLKKPGALEDITIEDVTIRGATGVCLVTGLAGHPIRRISLSRIDAQFEGGLDHAKVMENVPEFEAEYLLNPAWVFLPAYGLFCRHVEELNLTQITLSTKSPDSRPGLVAPNCQPLVIVDVVDYGLKRDK
jgi:polygalacturonase